MSKVKVGPRELAAYLEGELSREEVALMERELETVDTQKHLRQMVAIREQLSERDHALTQLDLVPALDRAIMKEESAPRRVYFPHWLWTGSAFALASLALVISVYRAPDELRAKGALRPAAAYEAAVQVYPAHAAFLVPVEHEISRQDALVFSFFNIGSKPFTHLMVFSIDSSRTVRWYYPEYIDSAKDPESIPVKPESSPKLLRDEVSHDYALGQLKLYALFTHRPLRVSEVEAWLTEKHFDPKAAPVPEAKLQLIRITVKQ